MFFMKINVISYFISTNSIAQNWRCDAEITLKYNHYYFFHLKNITKF